ncbi:MAG: hypothetical protein HZB84_09985 [Deltaproteobacteria bacterium]|nr:hypothetical protein [Deltaproteobacteria bacterium]
MLMLEYSTYSVISPEGCAAILWKDGSKADLAAKSLRIDAQSLLKLGIIDRIVKEPVGGAHRDAPSTFKSLKTALAAQMKDLASMDTDALVENRYKKFRNIGVYAEDRRF